MLGEEGNTENKNFSLLNLHQICFRSWLKWWVQLRCGWPGLAAAADGAAAPAAGVHAARRARAPPPWAPAAAPPPRAAVWWWAARSAARCGGDAPAVGRSGEHRTWNRATTSVSRQRLEPMAVVKWHVEVTETRTKAMSVFYIHRYSTVVDNEHRRNVSVAWLIGQWHI